MHGFKKPFPVNLDADPGETKNVPDSHPEGLVRMRALVEAVRSDIGDYDPVGKNTRFFDPLQRRPLKPVFPKLGMAKGKKANAPKLPGRWSRLGVRL